MGRLWAEHLVRDQARVVLWDLDREELERTAAALRSEGAAVHTQLVDVTDYRAVVAAAGQVAADFGEVEVLINNAGIVVAGPFVEMDPGRLGATVDVDLKALIWTMKAFLPAMIARGTGHIVNVSSASGFIGVPYMPAYAASKWGAIGLTESLRLEMELEGHKGIGFTLFCPSYVDTGMFHGVKAPKLVPLLTPEEAVARAYKGFRKGRYMIMEPFMVKMTPLLKSLLPRATFDWVSDLLGVTRSARKVTGRAGREGQ